MMIDLALRKLAPLMPDKVRQWRRALDLSDPDLRALLEKTILATAHHRLGDFRNRLLLSLPSKGTARGRINLGTVIYEAPKWPAGISTKELTQNLAIFGRSGAGKTNIAFHLLKQLLDTGVTCLFLDWKRTARHLLPQIKQRVQLFTPGRQLAPFPFNPFSPPAGMEAMVYNRHVIDVLGDAYTLGDAARSTLDKALRSWYEHSTEPPTTAQVLTHVQAIPDGERVRGWKASAIRALESVQAIELEGDSNAQATTVTSLLRHSAIIELDALAPSAKAFLLPLLCLWVYYTRLPSQQREELTLVIVIEEAHHLLYRRQASTESLMEMLLRQCREIGIGIIIIDQHPHLISSAALGNTYTSICLNLKDPRDINKAGALCLLEDQDKKQLSMLPTGQGIVKLQDCWHQPFLIQVPLVHVDKGTVTDDALALRLRGERTLSGTRAPSPTAGHALGESRVADAVLNEEELRFLQDIIACRDDGVDARYQRLRMSSDKGNRLKNALLSKGIIEEQLVSTGRTRRTLLRITTSASTTLGLERTNEHGSLAHEYWKRWYAHQLTQRGFHVQLEASRNQGRVDVLGTRAGESVAIEVETGLSDAVHNVKQDLLSGFNTIIVVATNETAQKKVEQQLGSHGLLMSRVTIVLRDNCKHALAGTTRGFV